MMNPSIASKGMTYSVFCDESRHGGTAQNPYMSIGGLWLLSEEQNVHTINLRKLRESLGLRAEVKWSKVSTAKLDGYKALVDYFFENQMHFRAIVIDQNKVDYAKHKDGDEELGFYTFYFEMLIKWLLAPNTYKLMLDFKKDREPRRTQVLKRCLEYKVPIGCQIHSLNVIDSVDSPLAQMADLLTGAVAASWCGFPKQTAKAELAEYIAGKANRYSLTREDISPAFTKLNIFKIRLR